MDYSAFAEFIDAGAVLGYGSAEGGKMKEGHRYIVDDETGADALSRIDEDNLKKIADNMGVMYLNMNSGNSALIGSIEQIKQQSATILETGAGAERYIDTYYYFAALLVAMLLAEAVVFIRRGRL